ncbi:MAG: ABC transporter ATP-binding protein [Phycisphaeraceae bacterium]|nr:ABC transporter ATP-binding protein [Phycisphaeraceae bacterium]
MIQVKGVSKFYGTFPAVQGVTFEATPGQVVGLLGPNGAGKTTTIRMITGFLPPSAGRISVCGHDTISASAESRQKIGYLPESAPLYPEMRVRDYLSHRARLYGMLRVDRKPAIIRAADRCRLLEVMTRRIGHLSKGFRQRVGLASAILHNPPVLILDEPSNGLDPAQIRETRTLIKDLSAQRTVLVSSHILPEVERTCDRVVIIARGQIRADGAPPELLARMLRQVPARHIVEIYVETRPDPEAGGRSELDRIASKIRAIPGVAALVREPIHGEPPDPTGARVAEWVRLVVMPEVTHPDLREPLSRTLSSATVLFRELRRQAPTLEQLFMRVIDAETVPVGASNAAQEGGGE